MKASRSVFACTLALAAALACEGKILPASEVVLAITTDMNPQRDFDQIRLTVRHRGREVHAYDYFTSGSAPVRFPATIGVLREGGDPVDVRVQAYQAGKLRVERLATTVIPEGRIVSLPMPLDFLCVDKFCGEGQTCAAGTCTSAEVDGNGLPLYVPGNVFGDGSGSGDGRCFDTLACFGEGDAVIVPAAAGDGCVVPVPVPPGAGINVAILNPPGTTGICAGTGCLVPLDREAEGFRVDGARLLLPAAICERGLTTLVSTRCADKTPSTPTCGPWSAVDGGSASDASLPPRDAASTRDGASSASDGATSPADGATDGGLDSGSALIGRGDVKVVSRAVPTPRFDYTVSLVYESAVDPCLPPALTRGACVFQSCPTTSVVSSSTPLGNTMFVGGLPASAPSEVAFVQEPDGQFPSRNVTQAGWTTGGNLVRARWGGNPDRLLGPGASSLDVPTPPHLDMTQPSLYQEAGTPDLSISKELIYGWNPPIGTDRADQHLLVHLARFTGAGVDSLFCAFDPGAGTATVPKAELKRFPENTQAFLRVRTVGVRTVIDAGWQTKVTLEARGAFGTKDIGEVMVNLVP